MFTYLGSTSGAIVAADLQPFVHTFLVESMLAAHEAEVLVHGVVV